ncbi:hypothetical protein PAAG_04356 [Paracoccidioides lutzii Pb01]|uniref:Uncharacterized protein n=1 Tax=Paracoccidioides lutzii (strain ATCC MYA-826 / Pb01) TaxID=502779 RepID=C1H0R2_PARBA|nr:hypothetical protein PAAG_04356 [Paracoccidioides lutzii Pb01]EEH33306.2 hypothetical protein PAAG_04356 [Paracoccidioides lutzii Pb01]
MGGNAQCNLNNKNLGFPSPPLPSTGSRGKGILKLERDNARHPQKIEHVASPYHALGCGGMFKANRSLPLPGLNGVDVYRCGRSPTSDCSETGGLGSHNSKTNTIIEINLRVDSPTGNTKHTLANGDPLCYTPNNDKMDILYIQTWKSAVSNNMKICICCLFQLLLVEVGVPVLVILLQRGHYGTLTESSGPLALRQPHVPSYRPSGALKTHASSNSA